MRLHAVTCRSRSQVLNNSGLFESGVHTILVHGLECAGTEFQMNKLFQFRHPDALVAQIGGEKTRGVGSDMGTDTTGLFGFTAAVDSGAAYRLLLSDDTFAGHNII